MRIKMPIGERIFTICNYVFLTFVAATMILPFISIISLSLSGSNAIISGEVLFLPKQFTFDSYNNIIKNGQIFVSMRNTVIVTLIGTVLNMIATILAAYPLSKKRLRGGKFFKGIIIFTMLFSGGLIPTFILVKSLGLADTYGALWFPMMISVYNMLVLISFFQGIPESLEESASIDGANDLIILIRIILPLSMPVLATLTLFYSVGWWNEYYNTMIYINSADKYTMTVKLMQIIKNLSEAMQTLSGGEGAVEQSRSVAAEGVKAATIVMTIAPIMCIYPFLQKHFVKGVMIGSVKG